MWVITPQRKGELYILSASVLQGFFPVVTILAFSKLTLFFTAALSTLFSSVFFAVVLSIRRENPFTAMRKARKEIFLATLFIGILFYGLFFLGLRFTTAGNASIMGLAEVFFTYVILSIFVRHERPIAHHTVGALLMILGILIILLPTSSGWHTGDLIVIAATVFPPIGNKYAQLARKKISSEAILFWRSFLSGIFLLGLAFLLESPPSTSALLSSAPFIILNGILFLGLSKILWVDSLQFQSVGKSVALGNISPVMTLIASFFILKENITIFQIVALLPITWGVMLITRKM